VDPEFGFWTLCAGNPFFVHIPNFLHLVSFFYMIYLYQDNEQLENLVERVRYRRIDTASIPYYGTNTFFQKLLLLASRRDPIFLSEIQISS
jgi:hypothetical protein